MKITIITEELFRFVTYMCSTLKIVGIATISHAEHSVAQMRELECTKLVVPQVMNRGWLHYCY